MAVTIFSWGYWGWGNATQELIKAFSLAEKVRGFEPPTFIDCRLRRQGRAKGFVGDAFRNLVGPERYRWMVDLGNEEIATGGEGVRIKKPRAVSDLLDLALNSSRESRRIIFYCACEYPRLNGELACHRLTIADLLLSRAKEVAQPVAVVEWPGGEPIDVRVEVTRKTFAPLLAGARKSIPFCEDQLQQFAALPWGSFATIESEGNHTTGMLLVGPPRFATSKKTKGYWYLPVLESPPPRASSEALLATAAKWRKTRGLDIREAH